MHSLHTGRNEDGGGLMKCQADSASYLKRSAQQIDRRTVGDNLGIIQVLEGHKEPRPFTNRPGHMRIQLKEVGQDNTIKVVVVLIPHEPANYRSIHRTRQTKIAA